MKRRTNKNLIKDLEMIKKHQGPHIKGFSDFIKENQLDEDGGMNVTPHIIGMYYLHALMVYNIQKLVGETVFENNFYKEFGFDNVLDFKWYLNNSEATFDKFCENPITKEMLDYIMPELREFISVKDIGNL